MAQPTKPPTWVVYQMVIHRQQTPHRAVCSQADWEAMERSSPGSRVLIRGGIANEGEAERLARGTSGDAKPRHTRAAVLSARDSTTDEGSG